MFCPSCGKILAIKNKEDGKKIGLCPCGFTRYLDDGIITTDKNKEDNEIGQGVLIEVKENQGFPHKCKKCGCNESEVSDLGASYGDESSVYLFRCLKCGYVERDAYGSSNN